MPRRDGKDFFSAPGRRPFRLFTVLGGGLPCFGGKEVFLRNGLPFPAEYFKQGLLLRRSAALCGRRHGKFRILPRKFVFLLPVLPEKEGAHGKHAGAGGCQDRV